MGCVCEREIGIDDRSALDCSSFQATATATSDKRQATHREDAADDGADAGEEGEEAAAPLLELHVHGGCVVKKPHA